MLLSDIILPAIVEGKIRSNPVAVVSILGTDQRYNGMDIFRLQLYDIEIIREREGELFNIDD
jgi:uncharacterized protein (UPF0216 family)